ncbi:tellurite resistance/C4-dicarboxylate transporter family protein [Yinghuangia soli]|uniref:Tellurite resistance/C4-dicarboxylate transporter family protein n=1 Tax=Yinghuangia soli TaxID=2908204 RepID=A0AA41QA84_9ACTN|nr:tellurite resistance/C4-dicarboxylate transporter family protein [Yinghuangia soli]MCF2533765.1 tellurite resistance/C4-dicarboxylate transporter family protein [Yinghuangia soli]
MTAQLSAQTGQDRHDTHWWAEVPPVYGSAVMATGIVSIGLHLTGFEPLSKVLMWIAAVVWVVLAVAFAQRLVRDPRGWSQSADTPPALTAVAATAVLGTRLTMFDWYAVAGVLLVIAAAAWPVLLIAVIRHWGRRMPGAAFLVCVATQGLAVLAGNLAPKGGDWLMWAALALFGLGLLLYLDALRRFDFGQVLTGAGDHWVAGGALAISAVAGSKLVASPLWTGWAHTTLRTTTLVVLGFALAWYAVLAAAEIYRPRLHYDIRRWATVFPLGMTAVACVLVSAAAGIGWLDDLGRVLLWIGFAAWTLTAIGFARAQSAR